METPHRRYSISEGLQHGVRRISEGFLHMTNEDVRCFWRSDIIGVLGNKVKNEQKCTC